MDTKIYNYFKFIIVLNLLLSWTNIYYDGYC